MPYVGKKNLDVIPDTIVKPKANTIRKMKTKIEKETNNEEEIGTDKVMEKEKKIIEKKNKVMQMENKVIQMENKVLQMENKVMQTENENENKVMENENKVMETENENKVIEKEKKKIVKQNKKAEKEDKKEEEENKKIEKIIEKEMEENKKNNIPTRPITPRPLTPRPIISKHMASPKEIEIDEDQLIEKDLEKNGYILIDRVMEKHENGDGCIYVKTINPNGHIVFVEMDVDGFIYNEKGSLMTKRIPSTQKNDLVPLYSKISVMECVKSDVCGILFECQNGICTLTHKDQSTVPEEINFTTSFDNNDEITEIKQHPIAYPIVRMSEIKYNPVLTLNNVEICIRRLMNKAHKVLMEEQEKTYMFDNLLQKEVAIFKKKYQDVNRSLKYRMEEIESVHNKHVYNKYPTEKSKNDHKIIQKNIKLSNDLLIDLSHISHTFSSKQIQLKNIIDDIKTLNQQLDEHFPLQSEKL